MMPLMGRPTSSTASSTRKYECTSMMRERQRTAQAERAAASIDSNRTCLQKAAVVCKCLQGKERGLEGQRGRQQLEA